MILSLENISGKGAIRKPGEGFLGEQKRYESKLAIVNTLPKGAESLAHTISWPVAMENPLAHITGYYNEPNYSDPSPGEKHKGIDIQVPIGTPILAPENATVVKVDSDRHWKTREMADIMLHSEESGLVYWLAHLNSHTVPPELLSRSWFDKYSKVKVKKGDFLGEVGIFLMTT